MGHYTKGKFKPRNPHKYKGDPTNIVYRSSWELRFCSYLDSHNDVIQWSSEEFCIPYLSPIDGKLHRYFPDFWIKKKNRQGEIDITVVEIKPHYQTQEPIPKKTMTKRYLNEVQTWGTNSAKWKAATEFCLDRGWHFQKITEKDLGLA